jgi:hypothetical protein
MTRKQIVKMTGETGRLVASNKVGAPLPSAKQIARYNELKAAAAAPKKETAARSIGAASKFRVG